MNVMAPVGSLEELQTLTRVGVDEVYCGVLTEDWEKHYTNVASINRVDRRNGNLRNYAELTEIINYAHHYGVKVYLTLNGLYTQAQIGLLNKELEAILETSVDGLIIADLGLLNFLRKRKIKQEIHASTGFTVFNTETVKFLVGFGVSRIILPRSLLKEEIRRIVQDNEGIQFEVFILNGRCKNIDGFCTFQHGISELYNSRINRFFISSPVGNALQKIIVSLPLSLQEKCMEIAGSKVCSTACSIRYQTRCKNKTESLEIFQSDFLIDIFSCGGCHIPDFLSWGINSVKIVGRGFPLGKKLKDIIFIRKLIDKAQERTLSAEEFKKISCSLYRNIYGKACLNNCYY